MVYNSFVADFELRVARYGLRVARYGFRGTGYGLCASGYGFKRIDYILFGYELGRWKRIIALLEVCPDIVN